MRSAIKADRVFWISPGKERKPRQQEAIEKIAQEYGDVVLPRPEQHMSPDGIHPTGKGYKVLGEQTR
jgi:lysophospholipase L1-like esterase